MMGLFKADGEKVCVHGMGVITVCLVTNRQNMDELGEDHVTISLVGVTGLRLVMMGLFKADGEKV